MENSRHFSSMLTPSPNSRDEGIGSDTNQLLQYGACAESVSLSVHLGLVEANYSSSASGNPFPQIPREAPGTF